MKIIRVESCGECPHGMEWMLNRYDCTKLRRECPGDVPIPKWCPLEDEKEAEHGKASR